MEVLEAVQGNRLQPPWEDSFVKVGDAFGCVWEFAKSIKG